MALLRRSNVNKAIISLMAAAALPLAACTSTTDDSTLATVGTGAAIGAAGGAGGIAGAVWADANNDGCADGYVREGQYYSGSPVVQPTNVAYTGERG